MGRHVDTIYQICDSPIQAKKPMDRHNQYGLLKGQPHKGGVRAPGTRKGFNDKIDIGHLENQAYDSLIGKQLIVTCVGRRHVVADDCGRYFIDEPTNAAGQGAAGQHAAGEDERLIPLTPNWEVIE